MGLFGFGKKASQVAIQDELRTEGIIEVKEPESPSGEPSEDTAITAIIEVATAKLSYKEQMTAMVLAKFEHGLEELVAGISTKQKDYADQFLVSYEFIKQTLLAGCVFEQERYKLESCLSNLKRALNVLAAGYEPTTPNKEWYCGFPYLRKIELTDQLYYCLPAANCPVNREQESVLIFSGLIPLEIQKKLRKAEHYFNDGRVLIYSPRETDFMPIIIQRARISAVTLRADPVVIGIIEDVPDLGNLYFEIARWGMDEDLKSMPQDS